MFYSFDPTHVRRTSYSPRQIPAHARIAREPMRGAWFLVVVAVSAAATALVVVMRRVLS
jgi:hypothetical protein